MSMVSRSPADGHLLPPDVAGAGGPVRIVLRPVASPLALGFAALAVGAAVTAALQLRWIAPDQRPAVGAALLWFVAALQLIACLVGWGSRDVVGATAMGILAGAWAVLGWSSITSPHPTSAGVGVLLLCVGVVLLVPATAALEGKLVPALVLGTAAVRFALTGLYELYPQSAWRPAAGIVGCVLAVLALYAALAVAWEEARRSTVLPLGRHGLGGVAVSGDLLDQVANLPHEAGVRAQL
jgi:uncharacterized protein